VYTLRNVQSYLSCRILLIVTSAWRTNRYILQLYYYSDTWRVMSLIKSNCIIAPLWQSLDWLNVCGLECWFHFITATSEVERINLMSVLW